MEGRRNRRIRLDIIQVRSLKQIENKTLSEFHRKQGTELSFRVT